MVINPPGGHWGPWQWLVWPRPPSFGKGKTWHFTVLLDGQVFKQRMVRWGRINFSTLVVWELPRTVPFQETVQDVWQQSDHRTSIQYMWGNCYGGTGRKMLLYLLDRNRIQHVGEDSLHFRPLSCLAKNLQTSQSKPALLDTFCFWLIQFWDLKAEEVWSKHTACLVTTLLWYLYPTQNSFSATSRTPECAWAGSQRTVHQPPCQIRVL